MTNITSVDNVYKSQIPFVRLRLNNGWDYVWFSYDEDKGFIQISSSYGTWSYIWSAMGEGVKLSEFFQKASDGYLVDKFFGASHQEYFDSDNADRDIRKEIARDRRDGNLTKTEARELVDALQDMVDDFDSNYENDRDRFLEAFSNVEVLQQWRPEYWDNSWGMMPTAKYLTLKNEIIPLIKKYFSGNLPPTA